MPKTLSLLAVLKKIDAKGIKSLSDPQWNTFLASDTEPNEIKEKIAKLEGYEEKGATYDATGELIVEDNQAMIDRFKERTGRASGRESLKLKKSKINVKSFKEDFLNKKKEEPVKADTTGVSDLVKVDKPPDLSLPDTEEEKKEETEGLKGIRDVLDDILKVLRLDFKGDRKEARDAQKQAAKDKRVKREDKLEGGGLKKSLGLIGSSAKTLLSPFQSIWDAIINFLKFTLIGILFNKTLNWFGDPKNEKKAQRIGKFFKDWWPPLATAAALFLTPLGGLVKGVVGLLTAIIPKLVMAIAANPWTALALVGTGLAVWGVSKLASGGDDKKQKPVDGEGGESSDGWSDVKAEPNMGTFTGDGFQKEFEGTAGFQEFNEGGLVQSSSTQSNQTSNIQNYNEGGLVQSTRSNQSSNIQNYNQGGSVYQYNNGNGTYHYNEGGAAKHFIQKYNQGGLVQNFQGGGFANITNTETTSSSDSEGNFSFGATYVSPEEAKERLSAMGMPSMELWDGSVVPNFGKMGADQIMQGIEMVRQTMVESGADPKRIAKLDELMDMPEATPKFIQNIVNRTVPGSTEQVLGDMGDSITADAKMNGGGWVKGFNKGGEVPGSGNKDTVPAMLTPGEFVMSKGAVNKYGTDTLENMNAAANTSSSNSNFSNSVSSISNSNSNFIDNMNSAVNTSSTINTTSTNISSTNQETVPAMLTPGEFVVSAPAVQQFGVDTLESMNAMGGGNNKPEVKMMNETNINNTSKSVSAHQGGLINNYNNLKRYYEEGGLVQYSKDYKGDQVSYYSKGGLVQYLKGGGKVDEVGPKEKSPQGWKRWLGGAVDQITGGKTDFDGRGHSTVAGTAAADETKPQGMMRWLAGAVDVMTAGLTDLDQRGSMMDGVQRLTSKEPVETPVVHTTNKTITLPPIKANQNNQSMVTSEAKLPKFRIPIVSSQRSMVLASLGIQDLMGG